MNAGGPNLYSTRVTPFEDRSYESLPVADDEPVFGQKYEDYDADGHDLARIWLRERRLLRW